MIRETRLPNGLTVVSEAMPATRAVAFGVWVRTGAMHETAETSGLSHLLEHMVFKGTARRSGPALSQAIEEVGGTLNAFTSHEHTGYHAHLLAEDMELAADVVGDLVFAPLLRHADLVLERKVVLEEIGITDDAPDELVFDLHARALWGDHPLARPVIGTRATVRALGVRHLTALHAAAYVPSNMVVVATGGITHDALLATLARTGWADRPAGTPPAGTVPLPVPAAPTRQHHEQDGAQTQIVIGGLGPAHADPLRLPMLVVATALGDGASSRLFLRVREEMGLAYHIATFLDPLEACGHFGVAVGTAPDQVDAALGAIRDELQAVTRHGLPPAVLARTKRQLVGQTRLAGEHVNDRLDRLADAALTGMPLQSLPAVLAAIEAVTPDAVAEAAARWCDPDRLTVVSLGPGCAA